MSREDRRTDPVKEEVLVLAGREDRLSGGHARPDRPRGGPRDRHCQTSGSVCGDSGSTPFRARRPGVLADDPTLGKRHRFVHERRTDQKAAAALAPVEAPPAVAASLVVELVVTVETPPASQNDEVCRTLFSRSSPRRPYIRRTCWLSTSIWKQTWGIDTVKQAEMFAAVRAAFDIPREATLELRDFPTLAHVIEFARTRRPAACAPPPQPEARPVPAPLDATALVPRRVPVPVLRPGLDRCKRTRRAHACVRASRVVVMPDEGGVGEALKRRLEAKGVKVLVLDRQAGGRAYRCAATAGGRKVRCRACIGCWC